MKKFLTIILGLTMILAFTGCGGNTTDNTEVQETQQTGPILLAENEDFAISYVTEQYDDYGEGEGNYYWTVEIANKTDIDLFFMSTEVSINEYMCDIGCGLMCNVPAGKKAQTRLTFMNFFEDHNMVYEDTEEIQFNLSMSDANDLFATPKDVVVTVPFNFD